MIVVMLYTHDDEGGTMPEYLALLYGDESEWESGTDADRAAMMEQYGAFSEAAQAAGVLRGGQELAPTGDATTIRVRDGNASVLDGPYAEVKEALGGYFILDCPTIDDAVDWAARIPAASTGAVEVRPVHVDPEA